MTSVICAAGRPKKRALSSKRNEANHGGDQTKLGLASSVQQSYAPAPRKARPAVDVASTMLPPVQGRPQQRTLCEPCRIGPTKKRRYPSTQRPLFAYDDFVPQRFKSGGTSFKWQTSKTPIH